MSFERQNHLVYGRRGDLEVLLHFGLRGWGPVDFAVVVNERQVLALLIGMGSLHFLTGCGCERPVATLTRTTCVRAQLLDQRLCSAAAASMPNNFLYAYFAEQPI